MDGDLCVRNGGQDRPRVIDGGYGYNRETPP